jgi:Uncharacterized membrane protein
VSFLCAGTIFRLETQQRVEGLTTSATLLMACALGICVALREFLLAIMVTGMVLAVVWVVGRAEGWLHRDCQEHTHKKRPPPTQQWKSDLYEKIVVHKKLASSPARIRTLRQASQSSPPCSCSLAPERCLGSSPPFIYSQTMSLTLSITFQRPGASVLNICSCRTHSVTQIL